MVYSEKECSRPLSRDIRKYFFKYVPVSVNALPLQCPFHPDNDMLYDQEINKRDLHRGEWQCSYCAKRFANEFYLDKHMQLKHTDKIKTNGTCLSDLCPVFGCRKDERNFHIPTNKANGKILNLQKCDKDRLVSLKSECVNISDKCFPDSEEMHRIFNAKVCDKLRCIHDVFEGPLQQTNFDQKSQTDFGFIMQIFKYLIICIVLILICTHATFAQIPLLSTILYPFRKTSNNPSRRTASSTSPDYVGLYISKQKNNQQQSQGGLLSSIQSLFESSSKNKKKT
eukprot:gene7615-8222_t